MRKSQEQVQIFNALHGQVSKDDLKTMAAGLHHLFYFEGKRSVEMLRNLQLYLSCNFILVNPELTSQKEDAIRTLRLLHSICAELEWQYDFSLSLMD